MTITWDLPKPYPEELAYSVVARYLARWGYIRTKSLLAAHLPSVERRITVEIGPNIHLVARSLQQNFGIRGSYIDRFTLLPYFLTFLSKPSRARIDLEVTSLELGGQSPNLNTLFRTHSDLSFLRFCPQCQEDQINKYNELFWVRQHQLPSAHFCVRHGCRTYQSLVSATGRFPFAAASQNCIATPERLERLAYAVEIVKMLCRESNALLLQPAPKSGFIGKTGYRKLLLERGFRGRGKEVDARKLDASMCQFLHIDRSDDSGLLNNWWVCMYRTDTFLPKTEHHLLFRMFLTSREGSPNKKGERSAIDDIDPFSHFLRSSAEDAK